MLETVDPSLEAPKNDYRQWFPRLKNELRELQQKTREAKIPVIVIFEGFHLGGTTDAVEHLGEALDPRGFIVHGSKHRTEEEEQRHWLWRYWIRMPARGKFGFFEYSWYARVLEDRVRKTCPEAQWQQAFQQINQTEDMLVEDGALILKYWLHISRKEQKRRLKKALEDPIYRYLNGNTGDYELGRYDEYLEAADEMIERTSTHYAPWIIVESEDRRFRRMKIFRTLTERIVGALKTKHRSTRTRAASAADATPPPVNGLAPNSAALEEMPTVLDKVDLSQQLDQYAYDEMKIDLQERLRHLQFEAVKRGLSQVIALEGWDAAGKGGTIRRLTAELDPHFYDVIPISKPTAEEHAQHYLWRFWKHIPKHGHLTIFDRSWYGRVTVERIEGFCTVAEWQRAYDEINEFELQLHHGNISVIKFWLHISAEEQLKRFEARAGDQHKRWKLTDEDWRNREKWDLYREAVDDMVHRTSTTYAPWHVISANCKRFARVQCMEIVIRNLEEAIRRYDAG